MIKVGDRVREIRWNVPGKVISIHDIHDQGLLVVIRLDKVDPILGPITTAFEGEVEILGQGQDQDIASAPDHLHSRALATRTGTTGRAAE